MNTTWLPDGLVAHRAELVVLRRRLARMGAMLEPLTPDQITAMGSWALRARVAEARHRYRVLLAAAERGWQPQRHDRPAA